MVKFTSHGKTVERKKKIVFLNVVSDLSMLYRNWHYQPERDGRCLGQDDRPATA